MLDGEPCAGDCHNDSLAQALFTFWDETPTHKPESHYSRGLHVMAVDPEARTITVRSFQGGLSGDRLPGPEEVLSIKTESEVKHLFALSEQNGTNWANAKAGTIELRQRLGYDDCPYCVQNSFNTQEVGFLAEFPLADGTSVVACWQCRHTEEGEWVVPVLRCQDCGYQADSEMEWRCPNCDTRLVFTGWAICED